jgi:hypothetical protein
MDSSPPSASVVPPLPRLAEQLRVLSELTETLTYRLLEVEERLASQELRVRPLLDAADGDPAGAAVLQEEMELRLEDTEERLSRLEGVLSGMETPASASSAASSAATSSQAIEELEDAQGWTDEEGEEELHPFRRIA